MDLDGHRFRDRGSLCGTTANSPASHPAAGTATDIPWILVSEDEPWAWRLAAPAAAHLGRSGQCPLLMALSSPPTREAEWLLSLTTGPRPIVLAASRRLKLGAALQGRSPEVLRIGSNPDRSQRDGSETVLEPFPRSRCGNGR